MYTNEAEHGMSREQQERSRRDQRHGPKRHPNPQRPTGHRRQGQPRPPASDTRAIPSYDDAAVVAAQPVDLSDIGALRALLRRHGLRPNKAFGQHLLVDRGTLSTLVEAAEISALDNVLEVGAGPGVLTIELAKLSRRVVAVELDRNI